MEQKKLIAVMGIILMILLAFQSAEGAYMGHTRAGYPACALMTDFDDMNVFWGQRDMVAVQKMINQGRCFWLKEGMQVVAWNPLSEIHRFWLQIRMPGQTETAWTFVGAVEDDELREQAEKEKIPVSVRDWSIVDSFLWIRSGKTTKQEILEKYGRPAEKDEDSILYRSKQHHDFNGYKAVKFIIDATGIVTEIRIEK